MAFVFLLMLKARINILISDEKIAGYIIIGMSADQPDSFGAILNKKAVFPTIIVRNSSNNTYRH